MRNASPRWRRPRSPPPCDVLAGAAARRPRPGRVASVGRGATPPVLGRHRPGLRLLGGPRRRRSLGTGTAVRYARASSPRPCRVRAGGGSRPGRASSRSRRRVASVGPEHPVSPDFPRGADQRPGPRPGRPPRRRASSPRTGSAPAPPSSDSTPSSGVTTTLVGDVVTGNGIGFSPDGSRMYWVDTARGTLELGVLRPGRVARDPPPSSSASAGRVASTAWSSTSPATCGSPSGTPARCVGMRRTAPSARPSPPPSTDPPPWPWSGAARRHDRPPRPRPGRRRTVARPRGPAVRIPRLP